MTGSMIRDPSRVTPVTPARFPPPCRLITLVIAVTAAVGASCSSSSTSETGPTPVKCQVALNTPPALDANGGTSTLTITAQPECAWTVSTDASWLADLSPTSGQGNGQVVFRAPANPQTSAREGELVVNDARARVTQQASACRYRTESRQPRRFVGQRQRKFRGRGAAGMLVDGDQHSGLDLNHGECDWKRQRHSVV